jgi:D-alanyl-D-alanine dipeptidase
VRKREVDSDLEQVIRDQFVPVEGQPHHKLHRTAAASFAAMRQAAEAEGVTLHILDADRRFAASRKRAAKAKNKKAIADFSSHNLGLAVDLRLSTRRQHVREIRTSPFGNLVKMTATPAHKWMLLRGASFGWYPFLHEPWHWEYNPPGFREAFRASIGLPADDPEAAARQATDEGGEPEPAPEGGESVEGEERDEAPE